MGILFFYSGLLLAVTAPPPPPPVAKKAPPPGIPNAINYPDVKNVPPPAFLPPSRPATPPNRPQPLLPGPGGAPLPLPIKRPYYNPPAPVYEGRRKRPVLFRTRNDEGFRNGVFFKPIPRETERTLSDQTITLMTLKGEVKIDALRAQHEHENDLLLIEVNRELHAQIEQLYESENIGREEYEDSRVRLLRTEARAEETKHRAEEFLTEVDIVDMKLRKSQGEVVAISDLAKRYVRLWECRLGRAKAAEAQVAAEYSFLSLIYENRKDLKLKSAASQTEVLKAQREANESEIVLKLARAVVKEVENNLASVVAAEKQALAEEKKAAPKPRPDSLARSPEADLFSAWP